MLLNRVMREEVIQKMTFKRMSNSGKPAAPPAYACLLSLSDKYFLKD